jgi:hypothetical protein
MACATAPNTAPQIAPITRPTRITASQLPTVKMPNSRPMKSPNQAPVPAPSRPARPVVIRPSTVSTRVRLVPTMALCSTGKRLSAR